MGTHLYNHKLYMYVASPTNQTLVQRKRKPCHVSPTYPRSSDKAYASPSTWASGSGGMTSLVPRDASSVFFGWPKKGKKNGTPPPGKEVAKFYCSST